MSTLREKSQRSAALSLRKRRITICRDINEKKIGKSTLKVSTTITTRETRKSTRNGLEDTCFRITTRLQNKLNMHHADEILEISPEPPINTKKNYEHNKIIKSLSVKLEPMAIVRSESRSLREYNITSSANAEPRVMKEDSSKNTKGSSVNKATSDTSQETPSHSINNVVTSAELHSYKNRKTAKKTFTTCKKVTETGMPKKDLRLQRKINKININEEDDDSINTFESGLSDQNKTNKMCRHFNPDRNNAAPKNIQVAQHASQNKDSIKEMSVLKRKQITKPKKIECETEVQCKDEPNVKRSKRILQNTRNAPRNTKKNNVKALPACVSEPEDIVMAEVPEHEFSPHQKLGILKKAKIPSQRRSTVKRKKPLPKNQTTS